MTDLVANLIDLLPSTVKGTFVEADEHSKQTFAIVDFGLSSTQLIEYIMRIESKYDITIGDMDIVEFGRKSIVEIEKLVSMRLIDH